MQRQSIFPLILLLVVVAAAIYLVQSVRQSTQDAFAPLADANHSLQTQVADLLNPTPTIIPDPITIIHEVQALARLETIQYTVEKVIVAEDNQGTLAFLFGDRLLFVAHGTVIAGIDLQKLGPDDLRLENGVLYVDLPDAEIFVATLDNEASYVYDRDTGLMTRGNPDLETAARQAAEQQIREAALEDGILDLARQNAEYFLAKFFEALGYADTIFLHP